MKRLLTVALLVLLAVSAVPCWAQTALRVGVLAFRPTALATAQWQPLAAYLQHTLGQRVELTTYDPAALEEAVAAQSVDVVFTTPGQFIALQHRYHLSAPLATQLTHNAGAEQSSLGGVIFTRADATAIQTLADVQSRRIAVTNTVFLGGYQMQAIELLEAGLTTPKNEQLLPTGMPQDRVVEAVLAGKVDVGFVRTGVLEAMAHEGKLQINDIKIIHPQSPPFFPLLTSTRLYPDWPVALMPGVDAALARRLAVALLSLPSNHAAARSADIQGFTIAADYTSVDAVLRRLHMSPYDAPSRLTLSELWAQHAGVIATLLGALALAMAGAGAWLIRQNRLVRRSQARYRQQSEHIAEIIWGTNVGTWEWHVPTGHIEVNRRWAEMQGYTHEDLGPVTIDNWMARVHPEDLAVSSALVEQCFTREAENYKCDVRVRHKNGDWVWVLNRGRVVEWSLDGKPVRMSGTQADIADRKQAEFREQHHNRVLQMLGAKAPLDSVLGTIAKDVHVANPAMRCCILLLDEDRKKLRLGAAPNLPDFYLQAIEGLGVGYGIGACGTAAFTGERVVSSDIANDPTWSAFADLAHRADLGACWSQPMLSSAGRILGTLALYQREPGNPTATQLQLLEDEARLGALAIERTADEARLQLAASVFTHAREGIIISDATGAMIDVNDTFTHITGYSRAEALGKNPRMLQSGRQGPEFYGAMWQALLRDGYWTGEMWNRRKDGGVYAELITISALRDAQGKTQNYVALFTDVTTIKEQQKQLERIAHYDALTNLPNRVLLADRLQQAMAQSQRRDQSLAVVYLDLDGFKAVNDQYGHDIGDDLLVAIALRMKDALREGDTLARIGGDEFVAVLGDLEHPQDCNPVLARLLHAAAQPVQVGALLLEVSASIGVTQYPQDAVDAEQLMRHADQAMYQAKQAGKNRYHIFDLDQDAALQSQHGSLERVLRALHNQEFVLHYQPKVNMKTGVVVGAEALIRWQHPERGLLSPAAFLPIIENHSISVELGEWVIATALAQMNHWLSDGLHLPVSVNIGARQLQQADFPARLAILLAEYPTVAPGSLELEVLETSAMEDITQVSSVMHACRALGVHFALDDFGTGYSSLTYLKHLPAELLKIDQSFVRDMLDDPDDLAIVESEIGLAKAFRRDVIAEGVETIPHGELLLTLGCELAQGYGIARPMPASEIPIWAAAWRPDPAWMAWRERSLNRDDLAVVFSDVGHRHWLRSLEAYLSGQVNRPPPMGASECHFGRWQESEGRVRFGSNTAFQELVDLHDRIHAMAQALVAQYTPQRTTQSLAELGALRPLMDELSQRLKDLVRSVEQW